jgi:glycosyltransferase involved in cell wall biosynthesis
MTFDCILVGSHLRFDGVWQRPQQIVTRLARRVPVLFVEEPFAAAADADEPFGVPAGAGGPVAAAAAAGKPERLAGLSVLRPRRRAPDDQRIDGRTVAAAQAWVGARRPLIWLYTPMMNALAEAFPAAPVVYDCMDDLAAFAFAPPAMGEREAALLAGADLIFAGGRSLYEKRRALGPQVRLYPSGVEFDHFAAARSLPPHALFANLPHPICGYVGAIDERIDFEAIDALANAGAQVALIGPVVKIDPRALPRRTNVHFTGQQPYAELPALLAGIDVALMPFALNAATASISPTKTPEYLAAGKPVVSTPISDVVADYGDVVTIAAEPAAFAQAAIAAAAPDPVRIARGSERARNAGWDALVTRMWNDISTE